MAVHKILIDDFNSTNYELIGIHSSAEDFRLAYFLNKELELHFEKQSHNIELKTKTGKSNFSHFIYENEQDDICWHLVSNKSEETFQPEEQYGIFDSVSTTYYLIPEFKKIDFLLKIENVDHTFDIESIKQTISIIPLISMLYTIDQNKLKSKNNLIF